MELSLTTFLIVCPLVFLAGFVDSIAGGGGVISLPAYFLAGLPPHLAAGTNKFVACLGTLTSTVKYFKSGKVQLFRALCTGVGALFGGAAGAAVALHIPENILHTIILIALPLVAVFLSIKRDFGADGGKEISFSPAKTALIAFGIGLGIGGYDGLVGPGTGTFLIIAYAGILGTDLLTASGCAKVGNLCSNIASLTVYLFGGKVLFALAIPAAAFCMLGNYLGARYAIKGGSKNVKKIMFVVLALLFLKFILELCGVKLG